MKIAVIADIHANVAALEAVIEDLGAQKVDEVLHGGDLVGRGPQGSLVATRIRELGWRGVRGNHEDYLLDFRRGNVDPEWLLSEEWAPARWMAAELTVDDERYLDSLPMEIRSAAASGLCLVHGSPRSHGEGLGPWSKDTELEQHLDRIGGDLLVCAHTHRPMLRELSNGKVVNVGAVGLPFNRDLRAQYAVFEHTATGWSVEFRQVAYEQQRTLDAYRSTGFEEVAGVTARLLRLELRHATPFLVPFIKWAHATGQLVHEASEAAFLELFDPEQSMSAFARQLEKLR